MVANRAIDPMSKLANAEWATCHVALPGIESMDEDQAYRAVDLLVAADAQAEVQEAVFFAVADLLNLEVGFRTRLPQPRTLQDRHLLPPRRSRSLPLKPTE